MEVRAVSNTVCCLIGAVALACGADTSGPASAVGSSAGRAAPAAVSGSGGSVVASAAGRSAPSTLPAAPVASGRAGAAASAAQSGNGAPPQPGVTGTTAGTTAIPTTGSTTPPPAAGAAAVPTPSDPPAAPGGKPWNTSGTTCLQAGSGKFGEPGPYKVGTLDVDLGMVQANQTTGKFTIFYPTPLEAACAHPIVAWGNGTGVADSATYAFFNNNAAAWGMVVIASQDPNTGSGAFHKAGIDYLLKQNGDPSSMFYKKLSPRAGTSGHSQGAFGSVAGAAHPNVSVNVGVGGGASTSPTHAALCLTGTEDIAADTCPTAADRAGGPFFAASWMGGDHVRTETLAGYITRDAGSLAMQRLYAAWFRCFLADDRVACDLFRGATPGDCGLCKENMNWAVLKSKNIP